MEDAATAEISRSQIWQWARHGIRTVEGDLVDGDHVRAVARETVERLRAELGDERATDMRVDEARRLFEQVALDPDYPDFLTVPAYEILETRSMT
jgi:malate synthase